MDPKSLVLQHLDEIHAMETALVTNLRAHIAMTTDATYRKLLAKHLGETQEQVEAVDRRRAELGEEAGRGLVSAGAGLVLDAIGQALVLTKGPIDAVRARSSEERMLKNARDECATEALEIAHYDALEAVAKAAGDSETAKLARDHRAVEERTLAALRKQLPRLALADAKKRTGGAVKATSTTTRRRSATTRKSTSARSSSRTRSTATRTRAKSS
jgi:ferritin-like metal-binding protein YciE